MLTVFYWTWIFVSNQPLKVFMWTRSVYRMVNTVHVILPLAIKHTHFQKAVKFSQCSLYHQILIFIIAIMDLCIPHKVLLYYWLQINNFHSTGSHCLSDHYSYRWVHKVLKVCWCKVINWWISLSKIAGYLLFVPSCNILYGLAFHIFAICSK